MMPFTLSRGMLVVPLKFMCSTQCDTPVRPGTLVLRADLVPAPHRGERRGVHLLHEHREAVIEHARRSAAGARPWGWRRHMSIIGGGPWRQSTRIRAKSAIDCSGRTGSLRVGSGLQTRPSTSWMEDAMKRWCNGASLALRGRAGQPGVERRRAPRSCSARGSESAASSWTWAPADCTFRVSGQDRQFPVSEVAVIDFVGGGTNFPSDELDQVGDGGVVTTGGENVKGQLYDVAGTTRSRSRSICRRRHRDYASTDLKRIYLPRPPDRRPATGPRRSRRSHGQRHPRPGQPALGRHRHHGAKR